MKQKTHSNLTKTTRKRAFSASRAICLLSREADCSPCAAAFISLKKIKSIVFDGQLFSNRDIQTTKVNVSHMFRILRYMAVVSELFCPLWFGYLQTSFTGDADTPRPHLKYSFLLPENLRYQKICGFLTLLLPSFLHETSF